MALFYAEHCMKALQGDCSIRRRVPDTPTLKVIHRTHGKHCKTYFSISKSSSKYTRVSTDYSICRSANMLNSKGAGTLQTYPVGMVKLRSMIVR